MSSDSCPRSETVVLSSICHVFHVHVACFYWLCIFIFCRFANRLTGIKENAKFQNKKNGEDNNLVPGLKRVVDEAKQRHNVK